MAIKKIRLRPEGTNDYEDVLHPETSVSQIVDLPKATESQAIAGVDNQAYMTPLSTKQAMSNILYTQLYADTEEAQPSTVNDGYTPSETIKVTKDLENGDLIKFSGRDTPVHLVKTNTFPTTNTSKFQYRTVEVLRFTVPENTTLKNIIATYNFSFVLGSVTATVGVYNSSSQLVKETPVVQLPTGGDYGLTSALDFVLKDLSLNGNGSFYLVLTVEYNNGEGYKTTGYRFNYDSSYDALTAVVNSAKIIRPTGMAFGQNDSVVEGNLTNPSKFDIKESIDAATYLHLQALKATYGPTEFNVKRYFKHTPIVKYDTFSYDVETDGSTIVDVLSGASVGSLDVVKANVAPGTLIDISDIPSNHLVGYKVKTTHTDGDAGFVTDLKNINIKTIVK